MEPACPRIRLHRTPSHKLHRSFRHGLYFDVEMLPTPPVAPSSPGRAASSMTCITRGVCSAAGFPMPGPSPRLRSTTLTVSRTDSAKLSKYPSGSFPFSPAIRASRLSASPQGPISFICAHPPSMAPPIAVGSRAAGISVPPDVPGCLFMQVNETWARGVRRGNRGSAFVVPSASRTIGLPAQRWLARVRFRFVIQVGRIHNRRGRGAVGRNSGSLQA